MKKIGIFATTALCASVMAVNASAYQIGGSNCDINSVFEKLSGSRCNVQTVLNCDIGDILNNIFNNCGEITFPQLPQKPETSPDNTPEAPSTPELPENGGSGETDSISEYESRVAELVNEQRAKYGLSPLKLSSDISAVARAKSQDMADNGYFSHTSPTYGSPFDMLKSFGISYKAAGENIAQGYSTPESVVNGWMNSAGHRANILSENFTELGVGYVANGNYWTQMFVSR
ncbi:MAG: serine protease [Oscillospiraceae bacterium]|nr:serine protease [Oscillospiraceae bacterium]